MKMLLQFSVLVVLSCVLVQSLAQERSQRDYEPVTLRGKITCARCELNDAPKCHTVIVIRPQNSGGNGNNSDNEDDVVYYFDDASDKKYHKMVCEQGVNGTVVGVTSEKNGVKFVKVNKLSFKNQGDPK